MEKSFSEIFLFGDGWADFGPEKQVFKSHDPGGSALFVIAVVDLRPAS